MKYNLFKIILLLIFLYIWYRALFNNETRVIYNTLGYFTDDINGNQLDKHCKLKKKDLKVQKINLDDAVNLTDVENENINVTIGGHWSPNNCIPHQKVAVILPYRSREHHLHTLIKRLHPMLQKQKIYYTIFIITQIGEKEFNRGLILNIGVIEALKLADFDCIVFNDVDLVPENDLNLYFCDNGVRQISSAIDDTRYHVMFWNNAGGVVSISLKNYLKINGHPNVYWGWGNEDDDFSIRTKLSNLQLSRPYEHIGRFKMVKHLRGFRNTEAYWLFLSFRGRWPHDGLNSLLKLNNRVNIDEFVKNNLSMLTQRSKYIPFKSPYQVLSISKEKLFTNISVRVKKLNNINLHRLIYTWESWNWFLSFYGWI